ncbi:ribokinase-like protein [Tricladium varicosporioides]|nr:ribokinase-like protein [Hymenoscyphus varicosporioides]
MAPKIITVIGSLNTDLVTVTPRVPAGGETLTASSFHTGPGGKGANQAVAISRLSRPNPKNSTTPPDIVIKMVGSVGTDTFGPELIDFMSASLVDTTGIQSIPNTNTGVATIIVESTSGENRILLSPGANAHLQPSDFLTPESLGMPKPDLIVLQLEIPLQTVLQILKTAKEAGVEVLFNPAPAVPLPMDVYPAITHLIVNETEAAILTSTPLSLVEDPSFNWDPIAKILLDRGAKNVIITLGSKGAYFSHQGMEKGGFVPCAKVEKVVDTTAAGDTFVGAYAVGVVRKGGENLVSGEDVKLACKASARTVEKEGAQKSIPWADEVDDIGRHNS